VLIVKRAFMLMLFFSIAACAAEDTPVVTVCDLMANPSKHVGQTVMLNATLAATEEFSVFYDGSCQPRPVVVEGKHPTVQPSFDRGRYHFNSPLDKKLTKILRKKHQARVTVVGVFIDPGHYFGHQLCCRYQLDIIDLVSVEQARVIR
jgi:hypothetical protein